MNYTQKLSKRVYNRFNTPDSIVLISLYPTRGETYSTGKSGVASYAKNVVTHIDKPVIVLCEIETKPEVYIEGNALIIRCFTKNSPTMWIDLFLALKEFPLVKTTLTQYDFAVYGTPFVSGLGLLFLGLLRFLGYNTTVTLHHVIDDITHLRGHVGLGNSPTDQTIGNVYNVILHTFYRVLSAVSTHVVVLEESLKDKLSRIAPWIQVSAIPHGVDETLKPINRSIARKKLGIPKDDYMIMYFGYVNWFKGADIFSRTFSKTPKMLHKRLHTFIAGGTSPTLGDKPYYQKFFQAVKRDVSSSKHLTMTGYIDQKNIATYFSAADAVILPYRHYMTASGVLSLALSYKKPFLISKPLGEMFHGQDFKKELDDVGLSISDICFDLYPKSIRDATKRLLHNGKQAKLTKFATALRSRRSYTAVSALYEQILMPSAPAIVLKPALEYT